MSSTDDRIVRMQFDNAQFKKGAQETKQSLTDLNNATEAAGKSKGLLNLGSSMQGVAVHASKMATVVTAALGTITVKAVNAGLALGKSLVIDPIRQGFQEYGELLTKQNVIMNATGKSANFVKKQLNVLNTYSDKTIYSFGDMTQALTTFVNAGVPLGKASKAIEGIGNASAFAGASAMESQSSFLAFSQSLSAGFVGLQDWRQASVTGKIGTVTFKNSLLEAATAMGELTKKGDEYVTKKGTRISATHGFDQSLREQWLSAGVLTNALGKFADVNTKVGSKAFAAAQKVRTFGAFIDTLKESIGSGWSAIFTALLGGLNDATSMWTGLSNAVGNVVSGFFNWLATALTVWRAMGGFTKTIQGFKNILAPIGAIFHVIGAAMNKAFPSSDKGTGKALYGLSAGFEALTRPLAWLAKLIDMLVTPMTIFFEVIKIGGTAIRELISHVFDLVKGVGGLVKIDVSGGSGFLGWLKDLGSALISPIQQVSTLLDKGKSLGSAIMNIKLPHISLPDFGGGAAAAGSGASSAAAAGASRAQTVLKAFGRTLKAIGSGVKSFVGTLGDVANGIGSFAEKIGKMFQKIGEGIRYIFEKINWNDVLASFNLATFATFTLAVSKLMNAISSGISGVAGFGDAATGVLHSTSTALKSFQTQARAKLILNIAIAIGILAASLWVLSRIPVAGIIKGLAAMGIIFLMLNKTMASFTEMLKAMEGKKITSSAIGMAFAIGILASAMLVMAGALILFNYVDWTSIVKGLATMFVMVKAMTTLGKVAADGAKNMIAGGVGIGFIAGSMVVLAAALIAFKLVDWKAMEKAGVVLAALVIAMTLLGKISAPTLVGMGVAFLGISVGMIAMSVALIMMSMVKWESIGKLAVVLAAVAIAVALMVGSGGMSAAVVLIALAGAMIGIAIASVMLNKVDWSSIGKLAVILVVLTLALAGVGVVAYFVGPALIVLGIALAFIGAGLLLFASAFAIAMTVAAAGTATFAAFAAGAGVALAAFLQSLAMEAPLMKDSVLKILQAFIDTIVAAVPMIIDGIKRLWVAVVKELGGGDKGGGDKAAAVGNAGKNWMQKLGDKLREWLPVIIEKAKELAIGFIKGLAAHAAEIGAWGAMFVGKFIQGVADHIGGIITAGGNLIVNFIAGISKLAVRIAKAAAKAVLDFVNGLNDALVLYEPRIVKSFLMLGVHMVQGLIQGIGSMLGDALNAVGNLAKSMVSKAVGIFKIGSPSKVFRDIGKFVVMGLVQGIQTTAALAIAATARLLQGTIATANEYTSAFVQSQDQKAIAARAKADGLQAAATRAAALAQKTKSKADDAAAARLQKQADAAANEATAAENAAQRAKDAQDRADQFNGSTLIEKAKMRSEDAQSNLDAAKASEQAAATKLSEAKALQKQANAKGVSAAEKKQLLAEANALIKQSKQDAANANIYLDRAKASAADALKYQQLAGAEAAAAFQAAFDADAKKAADDAAFAQLSDTEKAAMRRKQAADLQVQAQKDLDAAKKLALTDLDAANALATQAQDEANQARQYLADAAQLDPTNGQGTSPLGGMGQVINMSSTDAAAASMAAAQAQYDSSYAAAAAQRTIEFNQYNTSPEALSPTEIYRQSNNLFANAAAKILDATAA